MLAHVAAQPQPRQLLASASGAVSFADATGEFLPFSQVGGYVLGARIITLHGVNAMDAAASTLGDVTTEFLAELAFIGLGLAILTYQVPHSSLVLPVAIGLCIAVVMSVGLLLVQRGGGKNISDDCTQNCRYSRPGCGGTIGPPAGGAGPDVRRTRPPGAGGISSSGLLVRTATASYVGFHALGVPTVVHDCHSH